MFKKKNEVPADQLHSEDMDDIINAVPSWVVRWGITIFFVQLLLIFLLAGFVEYPDLQRMALKITALSQPVTLNAQQSGIITCIMVRNHETVRKGQPLAVLQQHADSGKINNYKGSAQGTFKLMMDTLYAPRNGMVSYAKPMRVGQELFRGQSALYIGANTQRYVGEMSVPVNSPNIKLNQTVIVKLNGYPYQEYGAIKGKITYISDVTTEDNTLLCEVTLELTKLSPLVHLRAGMTANAEIITRQTTLLRRLSNGFVQNQLK
ncbi:HlyD family secretion protein [Mucilaginibacter sp. CSA2-8R]|uniref:HlyD family secretion protein n=1 Tax=Mucilaginibacter sp. CSA2-8R TaxID=3141542 RepID=UPI00315D06EA